jgi:hypothetical protein
MAALPTQTWVTDCRMEQPSPGMDNGATGSLCSQIVGVGRGRPGVMRERKRERDRERETERLRVCMHTREAPEERMQ